MLRFFSEYFSFSRNETRLALAALGFLLASLIFRIMISKRAYNYSVNYNEQHTEILQFIQSMEFSDANNRMSVINNPVERFFTPKKELKPNFFDPNKADSISLFKMGLDAFVIRNILRYRRAGGRFYEREDLLKIYGMNDSVFLILSEYIIINNPGSEKKTKIREDENKFLNPREIYLELNASDSSDLLIINGIGPVYASRIVRYRDMLGGFYTHEQLNEIYAMDTIKYNSLLLHTFIDTSSIRKININHADEKAISAHPYITPYHSRAILYYRKVNNGIDRLDELIENGILPGKVYEKCKNYFSL